MNQQNRTLLASLVEDTRDPKTRGAYSDRFISLINTISYNVDRCDEEIAKFKNDLEADPSNAFQWASSAIEGAAKMKVAACIVYYVSRALEMEGGIVENEEKIYDQMKSEMLSKACYTNRSSSAVCNVMDNEISAHWVYLCKDLGIV